MRYSGAFFPAVLIPNQEALKVSVFQIDVNTLTYSPGIRCDNSAGTGYCVND